MESEPSGSTRSHALHRPIAVASNEQCHAVRMSTSLSSTRKGFATTYSVFPTAQRCVRCVIQWPPVVRAERDDGIGQHACRVQSFPHLSNPFVQLCDHRACDLIRVQDGSIVEVNCRAWGLLRGVIVGGAMNVMICQVKIERSARAQTSCA